MQERRNHRTWTLSFKNGGAGRYKKIKSHTEKHLYLALSPNEVVEAAACRV